ncbi:MAG: hypothetical protein LC808_39070, partial [Actinobacteria bacterium]|nr:hypothetical protein [Actinomycetota bacterium]
RIPADLLWFQLPGFQLPERQGQSGTAELAGDDRTSSNSNDELGVPFDPVKRRALVNWGLTTAAAGLRVSSRGRVGADHVAQLQRTTARLHALDQQHGGEALWKVGTTGVHEAHLMLEHGIYSSTVGHQLLKATARLQVCAGWLAFDAGRHDVARTCYADALALARQAEDPEVEIRAYGLLALRSNIIGRPREARRLAIAAGEIKPPDGSSPRLATIPRLRQAVASSLMAEHREADHAITEARRGLEQDHDGPIEEWCAFLTTMEVDAVDATCALETGRPSRAAIRLERAIAGYGSDDQYARNRALYRLRLAQARLDMRAVDGAAEAANTALEDLDHGLASWRVNGELDALARRFIDYPQIKGVDHFLARYNAMSR